jgi:hypothetical protein
MAPARSPSHMRADDLCHGFLAGVRGKKTFTLVHPDEHRCMHARPDRPEISRVDYDAVRAADEEERRRHPRFQVYAACARTPQPHTSTRTPQPRTASRGWQRWRLKAAAPAQQWTSPTGPHPWDPTHPYPPPMRCPCGAHALAMLTGGDAANGRGVRGRCALHRTR